MTAPRLECIQISGEEYEDSYEYVAPNIVAGAPSLTSIRFRGIGFHFYLPPLCTVTRLELYLNDGEKGITSVMLASTLAGLPALTFLVIKGDLVDAWPPGINVTIPSLQHFHLWTNTCEQMPDLLNLISAPLLHTLLLENLAQIEMGQFVQSLALTSGPPKYHQLHSLTILTGRDHFGSPLWMDIIHAFPTVTHFVLSHHLLKQFLMALQQHNNLSSASTIPVLPELHTLALITHSQHSMSTTLHNTVLALIASGHAITEAMSFVSYHGFAIR
jgi:hypothetical protein